MLQRRAAWSRLCIAMLGQPACATNDVPQATKPAAPSPASSASALAGVETAGSTRSPVPAPPNVPMPNNVILVTIDSLRSDMPWTGYPRDIAPTLTALAKSSVVYTQFYAVSSGTPMSLAGLLAGRYPGELERSGYFFSSYPDSVQFFPELLQNKGVPTSASHAHFYFDKKKAGFHQGFDTYELVPGLSADNTTDRNVTSPAHIDLAIRLLSDKRLEQRPFFSWLHLLDPHDVYMQHEGISWGKTARDKYDGEIQFTDRHLERLLAFVRAQSWASRTVIIVSSDHGEAFGEHKFFRHGFELYEVLVRVPLIVHIPGGAPRVIDTRRSAIDLAPTILELLATPAPPELHGTSLVPELRGASPPQRDIVLDLPRTSDGDRRRALIRGDFKLMSFGDDAAFRLYNLRTDPAESKDLRKAEPERFSEMLAAYRETQQRIVDRCPKMTNKLKGKSAKKPC